MSQQSDVTSPESTPQAVHTGHPTAKTYVTVAMALVGMTAAEVAVFYATWLGYGIIPVLALLSLAKFALVAMFYMHLKYDSQLFSGMLVAGLAVASGVMFALMGLFRFFL